MHTSQNTRIVVALCLLTVLIAFAGTMFFSNDEKQAPAVTRTEIPLQSQNESREVPEGKQLFVHPSFRFSFLVPEGMAATMRPEPGGAETIVFQSRNAEQPFEFQLFILPYSKPQIEQERIALDTHGSEIEGMQEVVIGGNTPALLFFSEDPLFGKLREVWFLMNGHLVEVTTYAENDDKIAGILNTLEPNLP